MRRTTLFTLSTLCLFAVSACDLDIDNSDPSETISETIKKAEEKSQEAEDKNLETEDQNPETEDTTGASKLSLPGVCRGTPIIATRYEASRGCRYPAEQVGCLPGVVICIQLITYAKDPQGNTWWLKNGCIPQTWKSFQPSAADKAAIAGPLCSALAPPCGARYNIDKGCRYPAERRAECISSGNPGLNPGSESCLQVITCVKDPAGNVWRFPNSCVPHPWRDLEWFFDSKRCKLDSEIEKLPLCR